MTIALAAQRRLTRAFVDRQPVRCAMTGTEAVVSLSGAKSRTRQHTRPPVVFTLCEPSDSGYRAPFTTEGGTRQAYDFLLVAEYGTDVRRGDLFDLDGHQYRVDERMIQNDYEVRAYVVRVA